MIAAKDTPESEAGLYVEIERKYQLPLKIPMVIISLMAIPIIWGMSSSSKLILPGTVFFALFAFWWLLNVFPDRRYRIGWDNLRIYMREGRFKRTDYYSIAFAEIKSITTAYDGNAGAKARFFPFDYIEIRSRFRKQKSIIVHPPSLNDGQLKAMFLYMYEQRPDLFPEELVDFMHSDRPL
jgi:hypothetical protein